MNKSIAVWNGVFDGAPSERAIRNYYDPNEYRVSKYVYPKDTRFSGTMKSATCFGIEGECCYHFKDADVTVKEGQYAELPNGSYEFQVTSNSDVVIVLVWRLSKPITEPSNTAT